MLEELGFHKNAGVQAEVYRTLKPIMLKTLNIRNNGDLREVMALTNRLERNSHKFAPVKQFMLDYPNTSKTGRGLFPTIAKHYPDMARKAAEQVAKQNFNARKNNIFSNRHKDAIKKRVLDTANRSHRKLTKLDSKDLW